MNSIKTNITSHKCQCDAPFVIFVVLDAQCRVLTLSNKMSLDRC